VLEGQAGPSRGVQRDHQEGRAGGRPAPARAVDGPRQRQQARRALDYLVGFNLSPLLWKKVRRGLSAGRVQSPALRLICEREDEIEAFESARVLDHRGRYRQGRPAFTAKLTQFAGEKLGQFSITDGPRAEAGRGTPEQAAESGQLAVLKVEKKQRKRNPAAPFTTSTLQQEASRKLGFTAQRTMRVAQQLYEGSTSASGAVGLITYMRTDSVNLARRRSTSCASFIAERLRQRPAAAAAPVQDQGQERPGGARGDPPDLGRTPPTTSRVTSTRTSSSSTR
jgi:DNA topoisomerase IA